MSKENPTVTNFNSLSCFSCPTKDPCKHYFKKKYNYAPNKKAPPKNSKKVLEEKAKNQSPKLPKKRKINSQTQNADSSKTEALIKKRKLQVDDERKNSLPVAKSVKTVQTMFRSRKIHSLPSTQIDSSISTPSTNVLEKLEETSTNFPVRRSSRAKKVKIYTENSDI